MEKILILANNDVGLYKFRKELIQELIKKYELYISLPYGNFIPQLRELGCKFINTPISRRGINPLIDLKLLIKYKYIMKYIRPNIVLTYTIKPNIYGGFVCKSLNIPYISNVTGLGTSIQYKGIMKKIILSLYRIGLKKASCVFFQNLDNKQFFQECKIGLEKHRLLPGSGVNLDDFCLLDYPINNIIEFIFISRIMKEKGVDQYIEAAQHIKKKYPNTRFHILGFCEEMYENNLKEMQEKDIIQYHSMQSDVKKYYKMCHCVIHPTYYSEGMSNVLLESFACGRPVITTNRSGCREIVDNGINGYFVKQKNTKDLLNKIEIFINLPHNKKKSMGLEGRLKVEREFDRQIVVNAYIDEIIEAIK